MAPPLTLDRCRLPGWLRSCDDRTVTPPYAAELRVYEPLAAFDVEERRRWQQYAQSPAVPSAQAGARRERVLGLVGACRRVAAVPRPGDAGEHAAVLRGESGLLICPLRTELRCWEAAVETRSALPPEVARAVLPDVEVELASTEQRALVGRAPDPAPARAAAPLVGAGALVRAVRPGGAPAAARSGRNRLRQAGLVRRSVRREGRAVTPAARPKGSRSAGRWSTGRRWRRPAAGWPGRCRCCARRCRTGRPFPRSRRSGAGWRSSTRARWSSSTTCGLVDLCAEATLRTDDSAGDVAEALAALQRGDTKLASAAYERVTDRWRIAYSVESSN